MRGIVTLLHEGGELRVEASDGLEKPGAPVKYHVGEGVTGKVVETGRPVVVPRASSEPLLLNRASKRPEMPQQELSFVCVPITLNRKAIGALSVDLKFKPDRDYDRTGKFLGVVASMLAQAIKIQRLIEEDRRRLEDENTHLRQELRERYDFSNIIGTSGPVRQMYEQVAQVAGTNTTVLIRGESGTGKELIAHAIHYNSLRAKKPFVKVSCAALPDTLIESELFGHEKGAFTGAEARKKGRFELAEGGTLFLDEIGDINLGTQIKLLRVLQEREFERLGGTETIKANVRMLAATNKDLEKAISDGTFREDLYYRLNVFMIFVPPLRDRKADLLLLADHFLEKLSREHHKIIKRISTPAIDMLMSYHWPGNVRELENVLERAVLVCDGQVIHAHHLPPSLQTAESSGTVTRVSLREAVAAYEKDMIQDTLEDDQREPRQGGAAARHDRTRAQLQSPAARHRLPPLQGLMAAAAMLDAAREELRVAAARGIGGRATLGRYTERVDVLLRQLFDTVAPAAQPVSVIALGGYGRRELCLHSDIDLLLLFEKPLGTADEAFVGRFLNPLWDLGVVVGHQVRDLEELSRLEADNPEFLLALLDARPLAGDRWLFNRFMAAFHQPDVHAQILAMLLTLIEDRHQKFNGTLYQLEPDIKDAPGALRDVTAARTIAALTDPTLVGRSPVDPLRLDEATDYLLRIRLLLHLETKRNSNVLTHELQEKTADPWATRGPSPASASSG